MRPLVIDDKTREKVTAVVEYAKAHPYHKTDPVPGDNPHYVAMLDTYRCVFTFTHTLHFVYRHLSISVPNPGKYPNPWAVLTIADLFGFPGWDHEDASEIPQGWAVAVNPDERCVVVAQILRPTDLQ